MDMQLNKKRILIFLAFAVGIPWIALLVIYLTVPMVNLVKVGVAAGLLIGFCPALANVATRLITKEGWKNLWLRPNFRRGWKFYLAACLLPLLAVIVGGGIFFLLFPQSFDSGFSKVRETFASSPFLATHPWAGVLVNTLKNLMIGLILGLLYFGEEFGWRAYLLPKLIERFTGAEPAIGATGSRAAGARKATLLVGVIWGVWHWPSQLLSMMIDPRITILVPLVFLVSTCALSVLLGWVTLRSSSVWPASIGHGMINQISDLASSLMKGPANLLIGPGPAGLIGGLGYIALALILYFNRKAFAHAEPTEKKETRPEQAPAIVGAR